jgi:hypothetical protein
VLDRRGLRKSSGRVGFQPVALITAAFRAGRAAKRLETELLTLGYQINASRMHFEREKLEIADIRKYLVHRMMPNSQIDKFSFIHQRIQLPESEISFLRRGMFIICLWAPLSNLVLLALACLNFHFVTRNFRDSVFVFLIRLCTFQFCLFCFVFVLSSFSVHFGFVIVGFWIRSSPLQGKAIQDKSSEFGNVFQNLFKFRILFSLDPSDAGFQKPAGLAIGHFRS